jgi:hypothetical protein
VKILLWDIETRPLTVTTWSLWPKFISHEAIVEEWGLLTAAWKWYGEKRVYCASVDPAKPKDDRAVIEAVHAALSEADVIVAHYGDKFDLPKFKARAVFHGLPPIPPVRTIDTKKVASGVFGFTCNRLDYLGRLLCGDKKLRTEYELWIEAMAGSAKAINRMARYNKHDVVLLERVYEKLRPYMANHPNGALYGDVACCPVCGSQKFKKQGLKYNRTRAMQQYQCQADGCRAWFSGETVRTVRTR